MHARLRFWSVLPLAALACFFFAIGCASNGDNNNNNNSSNNKGGLSCENGVCVLSGTYTKSLTLTADKKYLLRGGVFIGDDTNEAVLTIEPGTTVFGETSTNGMLVIRRGAKIKAEGTKDKPIVFTSSKAEGSRARGDWGGLIINGRATINACGKDQKKGEPCQAFGEGGTGYYGGNKDDDDSGILRYVRVEFAGRLISPDNELNGIAFQGVGSKTVIEYIQVHMGKDDGVEFFGGTANFKYILTTGIADDNLDWTDGWRGKGQFFVAQQYDDVGDNGIEADNNGDNNAASPRSKPTLSNITLIGSPKSEKSDLGMLLREGTAAKIYNAIVVGWNEACLSLDHKETYENAAKGGKATGELTLTKVMMKCDKGFKDMKKNGTPPYKVEDFFTKMNEGNTLADPMLGAPYNLDKPDFKPKSGSPAASGAKIPSDAFFTKVEFIGGVDPANDWTAGWTTSARN